MGIIKNLHTGRQVVLHLRHTVGREDYNILVQPAPDVSRQHGTIFWEGGQWVFQDQSFNGTLVNDAYRKHEFLPLKKGDTFHFGQHREHAWKLVSADMPAPFLESVTDPGLFMELRDRKTLFQAEGQSVLFFCNGESQWLMHEGGHIKELETEEVYAFGGNHWRFQLNSPLYATESNHQLLEESEVHFTHLSNEEGWHVKIKARNVTLDLEVHVYHKILAILAQRMKEDTQKGVDEPARGWMDNEELMAHINPEFLEQDPYYINTQVYRYRKETKALTYGPIFANLLERKRGKLRFNHPNIHFEAGH